MSRRGISRGGNTNQRGKHPVRDGGNGWEGWGGYMAAKMQKLEDQYAKDAEKGDNPNIFKGVAIYVNGYTKPSSDELKRLITSHGGRYEQYLYKTRVTHIIATNLPYSKIRDLKTSKVVKPEWITDSVKAGRLLSYIPYLLYTAQGGRQQGMENFASSSAAHDRSCPSIADIPEMSGRDNSATSCRRFEDFTFNSAQSDDDDRFPSNVLHEFSNTSDIPLVQKDISLSSRNISPSTGNVPSTRNISPSTGNVPSTRNISPSTGNDPPTSNVSPSTCNISPTGNVAPSTGNVSPSTGNVSPSTGNVTPSTGNVSPSTCNISPTGNVALSTGNVSPSTGNVSPSTGNVTPSTGNVTPSTGNVSPSTGNEVPNQVGMIDHQSEQQMKRSPAKAGNPTFLNEFYSNSRLHHLSTWKSEWRDYVNKLQKAGSDFPGRKRLVELLSEKSSETCIALGTDTSDASLMNMGSRTSSGKPVRVVMHIDMDCFFVSVGLRKRPDLRGKPVAVTHSRGQGQKTPTPGSDINFEKQQWELRRQQGGKKGKQLQQKVQDDGSMLEYIDEDAKEEPDLTTQKPEDSFHSMADIASCSYEARQAGVRNGMSMGKARKLCPDLQTIPYDFEGYQEVSKQLYDTVASYTHDIEAVSCDEMLVDCTDILAATGAGPLDLASLLRQELYNKTGCPASAGMGSNILLAKMATRKAKPNGQFYLEPGDALDFIAEQTVQNIPGVGWSMSRKLKSLKIETCGDLQKLSLGVLQKEFGPKTGQSLYSYARGQDDRPIKVEQERKSVSAEVNYGIRFQHDGDAEKFMLELSEEVHNRLKTIDRKARSVTLKVMVRRQDAPVETAKFMGHGICNNISKSVMLPVATDDSKIISRECLLLLHSMKVKASDLRGIGIQMQRLETSVLGPPGSKQGSQSILNFTVNRNASPKKRTEVDKTSNTATEVDKTSKTTTEDKMVVSHSVTDRMSSIEDTVMEHMMMSAATESKADEDGDFLGGYCHNIVDELSRRRTAKRFIPPLPTLPDISGSPEVTAIGDRSEMSSATPDYFPSPSQIDPEVLSELPEDIRKQIKNEMKKRKPTLQKPPNKSHGVSAAGQLNTFQNDLPGYSHFPDTFQQEVQPGCSHFPDILRQEVQPGCSHFKDSHQRDEIVPLPSPSQLDESCLNALPEEMQREIRAAYADQESSRKSSLVQPLQQALSPPKQHKSPGKSPGKNRKNSPVFKVPRGRPGRGRPKKLSFQSPKQPKLTAALKCPLPQEKEKAVTEELGVIELDSDVDNLAAITTEEEMYQYSEVPPCHGDSVRSAVNLCGAVSITEVRVLLREWLQSTQVPEQDDEDILVDYLRDLTLDHNLEQVDLVIKFLHRNVRRFERSKWTSALNRIVEKVQEVVKTVYGCKLKLLFQFQ